MKHCYKDKNFRADSIEMIELANDIIEEYVADGYKLTVRQLYYQFVARDLIPNTVQSYGRLKKLVSDARLAGMIDWDHIVDLTRKFEERSHWDSPSSIVEACASQFRLDKWADQTLRVEVWVEKQALIGIFKRVCDELDVPYMACRGYVSQSIQWEAAQRHIKYTEELGQGTVVLHFGDHDPSGIDMTRDIEARLQMFDANLIKVHRVALNMDQVRKYRPPPNPAKQTDARYKGYEQDFGKSSWELDALEPRVLAELVRKNVELIRDEELWQAAVEREKACKRQLRAVADNWDDITLDLVDGIDEGEEGDDD
jgi:hypothetical protein